PHAAGDVLREHYFETDGGEVVLALDGAGVLQLGEAILDRLQTIGHALEAAFVQQALGAAREVEQPPLERGRSDVGDEYFHSAEFGMRSAECGVTFGARNHSALRTPRSALHCCSQRPSPLSASCGRGITCTLTTCPTWAAAAAPASVAAFTAATSPRKNPVT